MRLILLLCTYFTYIVFGQTTLDVSGLEKDTLIYAPNAEILIDTHNTYNQATILGQGHLFKAFTPGTCSSPTLKNYWLRTKIKTDKKGRWLIEFLDPHIYKLTMYEKIGERLVIINPTTGFGLPFHLKKHRYKNFLFDIHSADLDTTTYYFKFETHLVNCFLFKLRPMATFIEYTLIEYSLLSFYYGVLVLMAVYNMIIFFRVRERVYLFYVLYVCACILTSLAEDGLGFQFVWGNYPLLNNFIENWKTNILLLSFVLYSIYFLKLYQHSKFWTGVCLLVSLGYLVANQINYHYYSGMLNLRWLFLCPLVIVYQQAIVRLRRGDSFVKFYLIGCTFLMLSVITNILRTFGIHLFHWVIDIYAFNIAFVLEVIVLSYALVERLRMEIKEKHIAQEKTIEQLKENEKLKQIYTEGLEQKVVERTVDLEKANKEIKALNDFLERKNLKLELEAEKTNQERAAAQLMHLDEFKKIYVDDEACKQAIANFKWPEGKFKCIRCGSDQETAHKPHHKRCIECKYVESVTAYTIFHAVKIPLPEAFYMVYAVGTNPKVTAEELSKETKVSDKSCASFKKKIMDAEAKLKPKQKKKGWISLVEQVEY